MAPMIKVNEEHATIVVNGSEFTPNANVHVTFLVGPKKYEVDSPTNEIGHFLVGEPGRHAEGRCLVIARDEASGRSAFGNTRVLQPLGMPHDPVVIDNPPTVLEPG
ncbi:hypothetical protein ACGGZK_10955 [Agromyces sp. MMS24-K17]|uniref:hypothetical protein n=1 Tax=Agromyces sp. MMS24-K17 TaxID=3372850 RepID=UPI0037547856